MDSEKFNHWLTLAANVGVIAGLVHEGWEERVEYLRWHLGNDVGRRWWEEVKDDYPEEFRKTVDALGYIQVQHTAKRWIRITAPGFAAGFVKHVCNPVGRILMLKFASLNYSRKNFRRGARLYLCERLLIRG